MKFPDFDAKMSWFNSAPLKREDLLGKLLVIDFWTFCCINCIHTLGTLKTLEEKYHQFPVVFLGVHCPKFTHEKDDEAIRYAILRYGIRHPVVNDSKMTFWNRLGVTSWPTLMIVAPDGEILGKMSGEPHIEDLDRAIQRMLEHYKLKPLDRPLRFNLEKNAERDLFFPSKLTASQTDLFIADSSHNQIAIAEQGKIVERIGSGVEGFVDGSFSEARLHHPQGLALHNNHLLIADTGNHAIRIADLKSREVRTLIGTGEQGRDYRGGSKGREQAIASPWDLAVARGKLFIAMAGTHQIWCYDFETERARAFNGSGRELHYDSPNPLESSWAQPSGLALHGDLLYIADSESSAIRALDLVKNSSETLAGGDLENPYNLFCYGDREGENALFQHPLALLYVPFKQSLLIADTYNHKLKWVDLIEKRVTTWKIDLPLSEPSGLALDSTGRHLFISSTNRHEIGIIDLETEQTRKYLG